MADVAWCKLGNHLGTYQRDGGGGSEGDEDRLGLSITRSGEGGGGEEEGAGEGIQDREIGRGVGTPENLRVNDSGPRIVLNSRNRAGPGWAL